MTSSMWKVDAPVLCIELGIIGKVEWVWDDCVVVSFFDSFTEYDLDGTSNYAHLPTEGGYRQSRIVPICGLNFHKIMDYYA